MALRIQLLCLFFFFSGAAHCQLRVSTTDSIKIKNQIEGFYSWYMSLIKTRTLNTVFNPTFIKSVDGMTTLDFTHYRTGLRKHKFSEDFIQRKVNSYNECVVNLNKTQFEKFSQLEGLDDFESLKCDFQNRYEWIASQEPIDNAELIRLQQQDVRTIAADVIFYWYEPGSKAVITLKRKENFWQIDDVIFVRLSDR
jgi:hypothetical protein